MQAQALSHDNPFARSHEVFDGMCALLVSPDAFALTHVEVEALVVERGREVLRQLFQDHVDLRGVSERQVPLTAVVGEDGVERPHRREARREIRTLVGDVTVPRMGYGQRGRTSRFPMDAALNLPDDHFSLGVRRAVALSAASTSFEVTAENVEATTGVHVGKRQVEELARAAAQDFDVFYAQRDAPVAAEPSTLLVLTADAKGIVVRTEDLRPATRKAKLARRPKLRTRLTKGEKKYAKRMAMVTAVYDQAPNVRTEDDILLDLLHLTQPDKRRRHHAERKRVWATIERETVDAIARLFDEAERRDPQRQRRWVVVVDGNKDQLALIEAEAARRGVTITVVVDFIHVLQYLWDASTAFHDAAAPEREQWVMTRLAEVLRGKAVDVAAGIRRSATLRGLSSKQRLSVDDCAGYLLCYKTYLRYDRYLRDGLPIASGVIEGACRHLVNDRLGITGAHWSLQGAEAILKLRALRSSHDFADYWKFHERREYEHNHAARYAGPVPRPHAPRARPQLRVVTSPPSSLSS
jgi:hypothetical protein